MKKFLLGFGVGVIVTTGVYSIAKLIKNSSINFDCGEDCCDDCSCCEFAECFTSNDVGEYSVDDDEDDSVPAEDEDVTAKTDDVTKGKK